MGRFLLAFAAALVAACSTVGAKEPAVSPAGPSLAENLAAKTVALTRDGDAFCSGVWVGDHEILTAAHCVSRHEDGDTITYATRADVTHVGDAELVYERPAVILRRDTVHDLALLQARRAPAHDVASLSLANIQAGQSVHTMGAPLGLWWSYSSGEIAAVRFAQLDEDEPGLWWIQATAPISPGNSGCGLFDDDGFLVGLADATFPRGENLNLFVHRQYLAAFLGRLS